VIKLENTQEKIIGQALKDDVFRQRLLSDPKMVLECELGISFPQGVDVQVHEETSTTFHLVLPPKVPSSERWELDEAELRQADEYTASCDTFIVCTCAACPTGIWSCH